MTETQSIKEFFSSLFYQTPKKLTWTLSLEKLPQLTAHIARSLKSHCDEPIHIALEGFLSAGKTTFVRQLAHDLKVEAAHEIESPTFSYFHPYPLYLDHPKAHFVHYDLHRLPQDPQNAQESILQLGIDEFLEKKGVHCIEWAGRMHPELLSKKTLWIHIDHATDNQRTYHLRTEGKTKTPHSTSSQPENLEQRKADLDLLARWNKAAQQSQFLASFDQFKQLDEYFRETSSTLPQIAFVGRSNVGKSSMLNALFAKKGFARVSKTPGKTRQFVLFTLPDLLHAVDLPGYGYAQVSAKEQQRWHQEIAQYFINPPKLTLLLIDSRHGLKTSDQQMIEYFQDLKKKKNHSASRLLCVFTKWDKIPSSKRRKHKKELLSQIQGIPGIVFQRDCAQLKQQLILKLMELIK